MKHTAFLSLFLTFFVPFCTLEASQELSLDRTNCFFYKELDLAFFNCPKCASTFTRTTIASKGFYQPLNKIKQSPLVYLLIVRDPYARAISIYNEVVKYKNQPNYIRNSEFYKIRSSVCKSFKQFLLEVKKDFSINPHTYPQHYLFSGKEVPLSRIDFIVDFDYLEKDLAFFFSTFHIPNSLKKRPAKQVQGNRHIKKKLSSYIQNDPEIRALIEDVYKEDFVFYEACKKRRAELLDIYNLNK